MLYPETTRLSVDPVQDRDTAVAVVLSTDRLVGVVGAMLSPLPSQGLPFSVHPVGAVNVPELLASKPTLAVVPGASGAFQDRVVTVTVLPLTVMEPFHRLVTCSVAGRVNFSVQLVSGTVM